MNTPDIGVADHVQSRAEASARTAQRMVVRLAKPPVVSRAGRRFVLARPTVPSMQNKLQSIRRSVWRGVQGWVCRFNEKARTKTGTVANNVALSEERKEQTRGRLVACPAEEYNICTRTGKDIQAILEGECGVRRRLSTVHTTPSDIL